MEQPKLVAFVGRAGSGKDTAADYLVAKHGFTKIAFADALRRVVALAFDLPMEAFFGEAKERVAWFGDASQEEARHLRAFIVAAGVAAPLDASSGEFQDILQRFNAVIAMRTLLPAFATPRQLLQWVGTDIVRAVRPTAWVELWQQRAAQYPLVCVSDCRFPNEAEAIRERGGVIVRLHRHTDKDGGHESERAMDSIEADFTYHNNGTLDDLYRWLESTLFGAPQGEPAPERGSITWAEYRVLAMRTAGERGTDKAKLAFALGLVGEAIEGLGAGYAERDNQAMLKEAGDVCWYLAGLTTEYGLVVDFPPPVHIRAASWKTVLRCAGALGEIVKKNAAHGHPVDLPELSVMGALACDILAHLIPLCKERGSTLPDVLAMNIAKLQQRYPDGFSAEASMARADVEQVDREDN